MKSVDIYPGDCGLLFEDKSLRYLFYLRLLKMSLIIIYDSDLGLFRRLLAGRRLSRRGEIRILVRPRRIDTRYILRNFIRYIFYLFSLYFKHNLIYLLKMPT